MVKEDITNNGVAFYECEYGLIKINYENNKVVAITIAKDKDESEEANSLTNKGVWNNNKEINSNLVVSKFYNNEIKTDLTELVYKELLEYFTGKRRVFDFPIELKGTDFQKKVWQELLEIPYGEIRSYKEIAVGIGNSKACRAVGGANNKNPLLIVVPCHRVVGSNGSLTGYAAGLELKAKLLMIEKTNNY